MPCTSVNAFFLKHKRRKGGSVQTRRRWVKAGESVGGKGSNPKDGEEVCDVIYILYIANILVKIIDKRIIDYYCTGYR